MLKKIIQNSALLEAQINTFLEDTNEPLPPNRVMENPNFRKWFGNSVTVNSDGTPMVFYHGATEEFYTFDASKPGAGVFNFSTLEGFAYQYAKSKSTARQLDADIHVLPVYLKAENPFNPIKNIDKLNIPSTLEVKFKYGLASFSPPIVYTKQELIDEMQGRLIRYSPIYGRTIKDFKEDSFIELNGNDYYIIAVTEDGIKYTRARNITEINLSSEQKLALKTSALNGDETFSCKVCHRHPLNTRTFDNFPMPTEIPIFTYSFKPIVTDGNDNWEILETAAVIDLIKKAGFDAVYTQEDKVINIFVFSPNQIKSIYNNGQFSTTSDNISEETT